MVQAGGGVDASSKFSPWLAAGALSVRRLHWELLHSSCGDGRSREETETRGEEARGRAHSDTKPGARASAKSEAVFAAP